MTPLLSKPLVCNSISMMVSKLWEAVSHTQLHEDSEDTIYWRWTEDAEYTTKSAYCVQFQGCFNKLRIMPIWKAKAEPKCRFFTETS
jgi:hypothetical protein